MRQLALIGQPRFTTDRAFAALTRLVNIELHDCMGLTDDAFRPLRNLTRLFLDDCSENISSTGFSHLPNLLELGMDN